MHPNKLKTVVKICSNSLPSLIQDSVTIITCSSQCPLLIQSSWFGGYSMHTITCEINKSINMHVVDKPFKLSSRVNWCICVEIRILGRNILISKNELSGLRLTACALKCHCFNKLDEGFKMPEKENIGSYGFSSSIWIANMESNHCNSLHSSHTYTYTDDHLTFKLTIAVFVELSPSAEWNSTFDAEALSGKEGSISKRQ